MKVTHEKATYFDIRSTTKIYEFDLMFAATYQDVFVFDISVKDVLFDTGNHNFHQLLYHVPSGILDEYSFFIYILKQVD